MKTILTITTILICQSYFAQNFDYEWSDIKRMANQVWDEDVLQNAESKASYLVDDIEDYIDDNESSLDPSTKNNLKELTKKVEAMEDFIGSVLRGRSYPMKLSDFRLCASELGANLSVLNTNYCIDVYLLEHNGFRSIIAINSSTSMGYKIKCSYYEVGGNSSSTYESAVVKNCARPMGDNRDDKNVNKWKVTSIKCEDFNLGGF